MALNKELLWPLITRKDPVIFDIGTHYAEDTLEMLGMYQHANVYMFEPDPRCVAIIKTRCPKGHLFEGVVSDVDGEVGFHASGVDGSGWDGSGSIFVPTGHLTAFPVVKFASERRAVPSTTLQTFVVKENVSLIDLIWMDVQGAEEKVILGGLDFIKGNVKAIFTEYENVPLYEGAPSRERILELLDTFEVIIDYDDHGVCGDMLLRNKKFYGGKL